MRKWITAFLLIGLLVSGVGLYLYGRAIWVPLYQALSGKRSVGEVVSMYGPAAQKRMLPFFEAAGIPYPPAAVTMIALKAERRLELWAHHGGTWKSVKTYEIAGASGKPGPKLREGDRQVPEGIYRIDSLNPNSSFHLSMRINYPNAFDVERAKLDGRTQLGGDIFIHGKDDSIGCLAMGDEAIEELFVLVDRIGIRNVTVIIAPRDLRRHSAELSSDLPLWVGGLYAILLQELLRFKL
ncbi:MAG: L,D-transpeptidase family protein [Thermodesulfobacteriota bacterium]